MSAPYERHILFGDIDAAGFVFFANYLVLCHEAYEMSLLGSGLELRTFFIANQILLPIGKTQAQYLGPLQSGDRVRVELARTRLGDSLFRVDYRIIHVGGPGGADKLVAIAQTEHVCIDLATLERKPLPAPLVAWLVGTP
jgi:1,4-dihydroxy-2-naphthoyl-CoA hydrolase